MIFERNNYWIKHKGFNIDLTILETKLIEALLMHNTQAGASYDELIYHIYDIHITEEEYVEYYGNRLRVLISRLREKGIVIDPVKKYGYKLRTKIGVNK